ncbi:MAG: site-specific integrase [Paludibacteraceae bacterium]|nr:site-specific integrase [Paludibacteraceae bacterium]
MYLNFMCRASKRRKDGLCPLELSVRVGEQRKIITLGRNINPADFNSKRQRVRRDEESNKFIEAVTSRFRATESEMLARNIPMTVDNVIDIFYNGIQEASVSLLTLFDKHNVESKAKADHGIIAKDTYRRYLVTRKYLKKFMTTKLKIKDILVKDITPAFVEQFYVYLNGYMDRNTANHKMKQLKKILKIAQEEGYLHSMPFKVKLVNETLQYEPLTVEEIRSIRQKEFPTDRLTQVRDVFVFACYTGLAFTDLSTLTKKDLHVDENGKEWIIKARQKTKVVSHIPLLPVAKEIWEQYRYRLPMLSNQKYNSYLKEIADSCGIKKELHSHLARHTFATILLNSGVDMVSVSKILGHSTSRITEKTYAQMMPGTIMDRVTAVADQLV